MSGDKQGVPAKAEQIGMVSEGYNAANAMKGIWRDEIYKKVDGKEVLVENPDWNSNLIVVGTPRLLAALMKNEISFGTGDRGIQYHAQGRGNPSFDVTLPVPNFNSVKLVDEYFRKVPDSITYIDHDGNPTSAITNIILVKTTLDFPEANGSGSGEFIREQGLFGGTATAAEDSGIMINIIFHRARFKDSSVKIVRFIKFIF